MALLSFEVGWGHVLISAIPVGVAAWYTYKYRGLIQSKLKELENRPIVIQQRQTKDNDDDNGERVHLLELNPRFVTKHCSSLNVTSLGQYLSSLTLPLDDNDDDGKKKKTTSGRDLIQREFQIAIGQQLITQLGPRFGSAILPLLGFTNVETWMAKLAETMASWWTSYLWVQHQIEQMEQEQQEEPEEKQDKTSNNNIQDRGILPLSLYELSALANVNEKAQSGAAVAAAGNKNDNEEKDRSITTTETTKTTSLDLLQMGEVGYSPSFAFKPRIIVETITDTAQKAEQEEGLEEQENKVVLEEDTTTKVEKQEQEEMTPILTNPPSILTTSEQMPQPLVLVPNPFIISIHWNEALEEMQDILKASASLDNSEWDPNDKSFPPPVPIHSRLLPNLHRGWSPDVECTHSKLEILRNRLFCVLLNKLSFNYYIQEQQQGTGNDKNELFAIQTKPSASLLTTPSDFIEALIVDMGHAIEICPRSTVTTFGMAACVKQEEGYSQIPLAYFFPSGYEDDQGQSITVPAPHGGIDLDILSGPLVGQREITIKGKEGKEETIMVNNRCNIQFYMAIEGLCGWHSNHNANVPWISPVSWTDAYSSSSGTLSSKSVAKAQSNNLPQILQAVRMASLVAVTINALSTELNLPLGGYGVLGVCNDTAALLDYAMHGTTQMYPLVSTGRYLMHMTGRLQTLHRNLTDNTTTTTTTDNDKNNKKKKTTTTKVHAFQKEQQDLLRLMAATLSMPSDLHASPSNLVTASERFLRGFPTSDDENDDSDLAFQLQVQSRAQMRRLKANFDSIQKQLAATREEIALRNVIEDLSLL